MCICAHYTGLVDEDEGRLTMDITGVMAGINTAAMRMRDLFITEDEGAAIKPTTSSRSDSYQTRPSPQPRKSRFQTPPAPAPKPKTPPAPPKPSTSD